MEDESTTALLLNRVGTALNYYIDEPGRDASVNERGDRAGEARSSSGRPIATLPYGRVSAQGDLRSRVEEMLIAGMQNSPTQGQRITYYRALLNVAASEKARAVLKEMLTAKAEPLASASGKEAVDKQAGSTSHSSAKTVPPAYAGGSALGALCGEITTIITTQCGSMKGSSR